MKNFIVSLISICMLVFMGACAYQSELTESEKLRVVTKQPTTDEVIKPHIAIKDIMNDNWDNIATEPYPQGGYIDFYLTNKDFNADIQYVVVRVAPSHRLVLGYAYLFEGDIYVFQADGMGGYTLAELEDTDVEWWVEQFKKYFFNANDLEGC